MLIIGNVDLDGNIYDYGENIHQIRRYATTNAQKIISLFPSVHANHEEHLCLWQQGHQRKAGSGSSCVVGHGSEQLVTASQDPHSVYRVQPSVCSVLL